MNNIFGNRLRNLRISENITGVELGKVLNVTKVAISNWESGKRTPDQETLTKIADYFDVTTDYLLGRTNIKNFANQSKELNKETEYIEQTISKLNSVGKKEALKRINELTEINKYTNTTPVTIAAHNDDIDDNQLKLMEEDLDEL